jgi:hypothetical protein
MISDRTDAPELAVPLAQRQKRTCSHGCPIAALLMRPLFSPEARVPAFFVADLALIACTVITLTFGHLEP